jgi:hypothetical protein
MNRRATFGILLGALSISATKRAFGDDKYAKLAPYTSVRWVDDQPDVEIDGRFYRWRSINGITVERLIEFAKKTYDRIWKKRLSEDLVQVMTELGAAPGATVTLRLQDAGAQAEIVKKDVPMTKENRRKVWLANQKAGI